MGFLTAFLAQQYAFPLTQDVINTRFLNTDIKRGHHVSWVKEQKGECGSDVTLGP